jgi:hypothetical protein
MALKEKNQEVEEEKQFSGFLQILISAGFSVGLASAITAATQEDEKIIEFLVQDKTPLIYMTQEDSKVDDKICLPLEGTVWDKGDPARPKIPRSLHPNCRCFWLDAITLKNLGQF